MACPLGPSVGSEAAAGSAGAVAVKVEMLGAAMAAVPLAAALVDRL